jgi:uracil-DNA glycosylase family 4
MYRSETYWARPVPGFGDPEARLLLVGLAPGAHGANRTGRAFTGDRSGDFLYAALHRAGYASQPTSTASNDGLSLRDAFVSLPVRCVPPQNRPSTDEVATCAPLFDAELDLLPRVRVALALGVIAWNAFLDHCARTGASADVRPRPAFAHGRAVDLGRITLLGSYHVSQQNTQTGRLTPAMFDEILRTAGRLSSKRG